MGEIGLYVRVAIRAVALINLTLTLVTLVLTGFRIANKTQHDLTLEYHIGKYGYTSAFVLWKVGGIGLVALYLGLNCCVSIILLAAGAKGLESKAVLRGNCSWFHVNLALIVFSAELFIYRKAVNFLIIELVVRLVCLLIVAKCIYEMRKTVLKEEKCVKRGQNGNCFVICKVVDEKESREHKLVPTFVGTEIKSDMVLKPDEILVDTQRVGCNNYYHKNLISQQQFTVATAKDIDK